MGSSMAADVYLLSFKPPIPTDDKAFAALRRYDVGAVNQVMTVGLVRDGCDKPPVTPAMVLM